MYAGIRAEQDCWCWSKCDIDKPAFTQRKQKRCIYWQEYKI